MLLGARENIHLIFHNNRLAWIILIMYMLDFYKLIDENIYNNFFMSCACNELKWIKSFCLISFMDSTDNINAQTVISIYYLWIKIINFVTKYSRTIKLKLLDRNATTLENWVKTDEQSDTSISSKRQMTLTPTLTITQTRQNKNGEMRKQNTEYNAHANQRRDSILM